MTLDQINAYEKLSDLAKHTVNAYLAGKPHADMPGDISCADAYLKACNKLNKNPGNNPSSAGRAILTGDKAQAYIKLVIFPKDVVDAAAAIMSREQILIELTQMAEVSICDIIRITEDGVIVIDDWNRLPRAYRKCIQSVKQGKYGLELKMYDRFRALARILIAQGGDAAIKFQQVNEDKELTPWNDITAGVDE